MHLNKILVVFTGHRFHDVAVEVSNNTVFVQRGFYQGPGVSLHVVEIFCEYQTIAQKVRLRIMQGTGNTLNIPEIEIYTHWFISLGTLFKRFCD